MSASHKELEEAGARWLAQRGRLWSCPFVKIEPHGEGVELPDVIGFGFGYSHVIECKTSRSDYLRDLTKRWRSVQRPMGSYRWWLCPAGLLTTDDLPDGEGLLYLEDGAVSVVRKAVERPAEERNLRGELAVLYGLLRAASDGLLRHHFRDLLQCDTDK